MLLEQKRASNPRGHEGREQRLQALYEFGGQHSVHGITWDSLTTIPQPSQAKGGRRAAPFHHRAHYQRMRVPCMETT